LSSTEQAAAGAIFAGGVERIFILVVQIALSVMVMKSIRERKYIWLVIAFVIHTAVNFGVALATLNSVNTWAIEAALLAVAAGMAWFLWKEYIREISNSSRSQD